jgi:predicted anti-sigma-YlaC factor YlaD
LTCFETEAELVDLLDGRLDAAGEVRVFVHLETCADCRGRADAWGRLVPLMRRLVSPPPSPLRARRMEVEIERLLVEEAPRLGSPAARGLRWAGPSVAVAAAIVIVALRLAGGNGSALRADITFVDGIARSGVGVLRAGTSLEGNAELVVEERGVVVLSVAGASLKVEGAARLALAGQAQHVGLRLDEGTLTAAVAHRTPNATFVVATRDGRVEVRGTRFVVHADAAGSDVAVQEGRVAVFTRGGAERRVDAGGRIALGPAGFMAPATSLAAPLVTAPAVEAEAATPSRPCGVTGPGCKAAAREVRAAMRAGQVARALRLIEQAMPTASGACDDVSQGASSCHDELRYLRAEALRQDGRLDASIAAYKALDHRAAPAATRQNAFYAAAQLEQRLGRFTSARADFERAFAAAPAGALREEALLGEMESAVGAGDAPGAEELARRYLAAFPSGLGAPRARAAISARGSAPR